MVNPDRSIHNTSVYPAVVIKTVSTNDPFLNKLCGEKAEFINLVDGPVNANDESVVKDTENIDPVFNVKEGIRYLIHDPTQDWKKMKPKELGEDESLKVNKVTTRNMSKTGEGTSKSPKTTVKAITSGQCKRAKQRDLFDYEGGLKEHYRRLWEYRQTILDSNQGSTCRLDDEETESSNYYFRRIYVCFKGVKEGWLAGCRKMYPIAWAVVKVENNENWCWFISLIQEDLHLETGEGLTIIFDSHKVKRIENEAKTELQVRCTVAVRGGRHVSTRYCSGGGWTNQSVTRGTGVCQYKVCVYQYEVRRV
ncbi:hypothetical protein Tco_0996962 [Tanacetum coccineum]